MSVAIVHDWLVTSGGAEKVLASLLKIFPKADIYTIVNFLPRHEASFLKDHKIHTSFIQNLPLAKKYYRHYLPLMPIAIEQLNLSDYDLVISSSYAVAKGVITSPGQTHICYCHSPMRYAWDLQHQYLNESGLNHGFKSVIARYLLHKLRIWDTRSANGVDHFIANSNFVAERIRKFYRRESTVIYPPVSFKSFNFNEPKEDYYITASRLVPYKRIDLIVEAFNSMPSKRLVVVGDGPELHKIKKLAKENILLTGRVSDEKLGKLLTRARAFVFAAEEDFGILPLEAQACGTPVIAFGKGGSLETVDGITSATEAITTNKPTGVFFSQQNRQSICKAVEFFEEKQKLFTAEACKDKAKKFCESVFIEKIRALCNSYSTQSTLPPRHSRLTVKSAPSKEVDYSP